MVSVKETIQVPDRPQKSKRYNFSDEVFEMVRKFDAQNNLPNRFNNFKMPHQMNLPENGKLTLDGKVTENNILTNDSLPINGCDFSQYSKINKTLINSWFKGYQEYSILSQNGIIQNIIQCYAQYSTSEWVEIKSVSKDKADKSDKIAQIEQAFKDFKLQDKFRNCMEMVVTFGGCKLYPKIKGDDSRIGGDTLTTKFMLESMGKGDLLYFKPIEPLYVTPIEFNATQPLAENYYEPSMWTALANPIHTSRMLHFSYNYVPTLLKPVYWFYGMPLIQLVLDYIFGFETVRQNVVGISGRYNLNIFKTNMEALLDYKSGSTFKSGQDLETRLKLAQYFMSNFSVFAMSNDEKMPEEWQQFNMTIAGLDGLLNQNAELVCAVCQTPAVILFGTSPKGFNSTGEHEVKIFQNMIRSKQNTILLPHLIEAFKLVQIHLFGKIDQDLQIAFRPLSNPSLLERQQIQTSKKDVNVAYVQEGILSVSEVRKNLNDDPDSGFSDLEEDLEIELDEDASENEEKVSA